MEPSIITPSPPPFLAPKPQSPITLLHKSTINPLHLKQIHAHLLRTNPNLPTPLLTHLLRHYTTHHHHRAAAAIFNQFHDHSPPTFAFNLMIRSHTQMGSPIEGISLYNVMMEEGVAPDKFTFTFAVKACAEAKAVRKGREVLGFAIKTGFWKDLILMNNVMDLYFRVGATGDAWKVFDRMRVRSVVSWTIVLKGLIRAGEMREAWRVFGEMDERNVVSWSTMIDGCVGKGMVQEGFELFMRMQEEGVRPNEFTLVSLLRGCAKLGSLELGAVVHEYAVKNGFEMGVYLGTALLDMYSKCGNIAEARRVFDKMEKKSLSTWNAMITSLGVHGYGEEALMLFDRMLEENVQPCAITFVGVLCGCVQTENVDRGLRLFEYMYNSCGILPILEHYVRMFQLWNLEKTMMNVIDT
ncbi:hypothetical protein Droror1_Dr00014021 [Drosera rotundifolia]